MGLFNKKKNVAPSAPTGEGVRCMLISEAYSMDGRGCVVKGTVDTGTLTPGDDVVIVHHDNSETRAKLVAFHDLDGEDNIAYEGDDVTMLLDIMKNSKVKDGDELKKL